MESYHKTRLAPTPSGFLHLGNVLSFSVTAALARRAGAAILLRIDDLDQGRVKNEYVEDIFETLRFLEIPWDEGPRDAEEFVQAWSQTHRMALYRDALAQLREEGKLFACDCSRSNILLASSHTAYPGTCREKGLSLDAAGYAWRVRTTEANALEGGEANPLKGGEANALEGGEARVAAFPAEMKDFVVRKKDGNPAYQLSSVVDDLHFGVDLVVRGDDLRASTVAQQWLAAALGRTEFRRIRFIHHPLLLDEKMEKMSKSAGSESVRLLRRTGMKAAGVFALIGRRLGSSVETGNWQELAAVTQTLA